MRYLLDTSVLSEPTRPEPSAHLLDRFHEHARAMATASLVLHELLFGCARLPESHRRRVLERYVDEVVGKLPLLP